MAQCFVIQPFDGAAYDKRFRDIYDPAIREAGLDPYRVDRDPSVLVPIDEIEEGITRSAVCFADISEDNPNVWFELGFAIAAGKPVVMVCSELRTRFPFDVQHRSIVRYKTESTSDFKELESEIIRRLKGSLNRQSEIGALAEISKIAPVTAGLIPPEIAALVIITSHFSLQKYAISGYQVAKDMERSGYTEIATALALRTLEKKQMIGVRNEQDINGEFLGHHPTERGLDWLEANQDKIPLRLDMNQSTWNDSDLPF